MDEKTHLFAEFVLAGVLFGLLENVLLIFFSSLSLSATALALSLIVTIPFAALGELVVDRWSLLPHPETAWMRRLEVVTEFFVFGVAMGVVEDLFVLLFLTGEPISLQMIGLAAAITFPFAFVGEVLVDEHVVEG